MAIVEQEERKKRRSRLGRARNNNEEDGSRKLKAGLQSDIENGSNKESGSGQMRSRRVIGKAIVNRWEGGGDLETGDEEGSRSRVRRKEASEKKLRRRRGKNGENGKTTTRYNVTLDEDVTSDAQLIGGGRMREEAREYYRENESKEDKAEIDQNQSKTDRDSEEIAEQKEEGEVRKERRKKEEEKEKKGVEEKGRMVELGQPAVEQLLVGKRLPQKVTTLLPSIHRASKV